MSFLNPYFFWGVMAVSVPILLHLIKRERARKIEFPTLMYLRKVSKKTIRYQKLRHLLLLLLRILALLLLVLTFTRPFREFPRAAASTDRPTTAHVILLDNSLSMGYGDRWVRARRAAADIARSAAAGDKVALLEFSDRVRVRSQLIGEPAPILGLLESGMELTDQPTRFGQALKIAEKIALDSGTDRRIVHWISDFQKNGVVAEELDSPISSLVQIKPVDLGAEEYSNLAFSDVKVLEGDEQAGGGLTIKASVANFGTADRKSVGVSLSLDGKVAARKLLDVEKSSAQGVEFQLPGLAQGSHPIVLEVEDENLGRDNRFHLTVQSRARTPVISVENTGSGRGGRSPSFFLTHALNISVLSPYRLTVATPQQADGMALSSGLLIWNGAAADSGSLQRKIEELVKNGGGLGVVLSDRLSAADFNRFFGSWLPVKVGVTSPGRAGGPSRKTRSGEDYALLTDVRMDHVIFRPFSEPHSGSFSTAKFFKYARLEPGSGAEVLGRFDNGDPALVAAGVDKGRVLVFASSADDAWNDLPLKAVYAPFWQQVLRYLDDRQEPRRWVEVGETISPSRLLYEATLQQGKVHADSNQAVAVLNPGKQRIPLQTGDSAVAVDRVGFYEVRTSNISVAVAVNPVLMESDLAHGDAEEIIAGWASTDPGSQQVVSEDEKLSAEARERQNPFWRLILAAVLLFLVAESGLANQSVLKPE